MSRSAVPSSTPLMRAHVDPSSSERKTVRLLSCHRITCCKRSRTGGYRAIVEVEELTGSREKGRFRDLWILGSVPVEDELT